MALDSESDENKQKLLEEAEKLHLHSIKVSKKALGEKNIITASNYGNLGRLYQSMKIFKEAEKNLVKCIQIYEELLGGESTELALKLGHLASLYTYDTNQQDAAEKLYLRSIALFVKTYGDNYSGLEYDYRGLINVYQKKGDQKKEARFKQVLEKWKDGQKLKKKQTNPKDITMDDIQSISKMYFNLRKSQS